MTPRDSGPDSVGFVIPALARPSGGTAYDREVVAAWPADAPTVFPTVIRVRRTGRGARLETVLRAHRVTVVDGLIGAEHPEVIERVEADGHQVVLIVHLPRPDDAGLTDDDRARLAALEERAVLAASHVVVPSQWAASDLQSRYGRTDLVVATPGVQSVAPASPNDPPVVLQLGAVSPLKNQALTVRAALACRDLDFVLRLVGPIVDEPYAAELADAMAPLGPRAGLEPPALGPARDAVLDDADLVVSVARKETYGLTVIEGLARGLPAVVGSGTGAEEALRSGGTTPGAAVSTEDPAELADVLRQFVTDAGLRDHWREAALTARERLRPWTATSADIARVCVDALSAG